MMPRGIRGSAFPRWETTLPPNFRVSCETPNNDPHSHIRIPGNYPGRHIGKMLHALRQQFRLDVTGPWNIGENLRFCRPGNPIPPTDLGLRCPRLITLRHVVLHRVNSRIILAPTLLMHVPIIRLHSRFRIKCGQSLPTGRRAQKNPVEGIRTHFMTAAGVQKRLP
jgi:hypothetical protein